MADPEVGKTDDLPLVTHQRGRAQAEVGGLKAAHREALLLALLALQPGVRHLIEAW